MRHLIIHSIRGSFAISTQPSALLGNSFLLFLSNSRRVKSARQCEDAECGCADARELLGLAVMPEPAPRLTSATDKGQSSRQARLYLFITAFVKILIFGNTAFANLGLNLWVEYMACLYKSLQPCKHRRSITNQILDFKQCPHIIGSCTVAF